MALQPTANITSKYGIKNQELSYEKKSQQKKYKNMKTDFKFHIRLITYCCSNKPFNTSFHLFQFAFSPPLFFNALKTRFQNKAATFLHQALVGRKIYIYCILSLEFGKLFQGITGSKRVMRQSSEMATPRRRRRRRQAQQLGRGGGRGEL